MKPASTAIAMMARTEPGGDQWIHLLPAGSFNGRDGRGPYRVADADAVVLATREAAGRREIPIDYDRQIDFAAKNGRPAPAAGWVKGLRVEGDGVWGLVEWTARAAQHLANREYRYLSPVFNHTKSGEVTRLLRAALTNDPNLDQLTTLAHRDDDGWTIYPNCGHCWNCLTMQRLMRSPERFAS